MRNENTEISDLSNELATARKLLDLAVDGGQSSLANQLLVTIGKLAREWELSRFRSGEVLSRDTVARVAQEIGTTLAAVLRERGVPGFETVVDEVMARMMGVVQEITNDPPKVGYQDA